MIGALRYVLSGGAPLAVETLREAEAEAAFGVPVREAYGLSESCGPVCFNPMDGPSRPGTVGRPLEGVEFRIVTPEGVEVPERDTETPGELRIHRPVVMSGYLGLPEAGAAAFDDDGWLRTGDLARRDEERYYRIVGRLKDINIRNGYNVYPREVEDALYVHPDVAEAEFSAFVRERLLSYKGPQPVTLMDWLPKNGTGKIVKDLLR
ncbi:AMP-binding protein [Micrococcus luteus]|nr:AMP-binding protein [Micrococcus luteus]